MHSSQFGIRLRQNGFDRLTKEALLGVVHGHDDGDQGRRLESGPGFDEYGNVARGERVV